MNYDFMLSGSSGMARKLVRLSRVMTINLDPAIIALAKTGRLTDEDFEEFPSLLPKERKAIQQLIDCDFRAVLPAKGNRHIEITMMAAKIAGISPILAIGMPHEFHTWNKMARAIGVELVYIAGKQSGELEAPDADLVRDKRSGILLMNEVNATFGVEGILYPMDFPRTVILTNRFNITEIEDCIARIFPDAPSDIISNKNPLFKNIISGMGFRTTKPEHLAFLFNLITDLIPSDIVFDDTDSAF